MTKELGWPKAIAEVRGAFYELVNDRAKLIQGTQRLGHRYRDKCREFKQAKALYLERVQSTHDLDIRLGWMQNERDFWKDKAHELTKDKTCLEALLGSERGLRMYWYQETHRARGWVAELTQDLQDAMPQIPADEIRVFALRLGAPPQKANELAEVYQEAMDLKGLGEHGAGKAPASSSGDQ